MFDLSCTLDQIDELVNLSTKGSIEILQQKFIQTEQEGCYFDINPDSVQPTKKMKSEIV